MGGLRTAGSLLAALALLAVSAGAADVGVSGRPAGEGVVELVAIERPGAQLARAVAALAHGDSDEADALLDELAAREPLIADHARLLQMRSRVEAGRYERAIEMRALWSDAASPIAHAFYSLLGDAYAAVGDEEAARTAWKLAVDGTRDEERLASLQLAIGASYERAGAPEAAAAEYLRVWRTYPVGASGAAAGEHLEALEKQLDRSLRTAVHYRQRGDAFFRRRHNQEALDAYERALAGPLSQAQRSAALRQRAETLFRLRRYADAALAFAALPGDDEIAISHARSLARSGSVPQAVAELEGIAERSRSWQAARALLLAALLLDGENEPARAREHFLNLLRRYPRTGYAASALWSLGWSAYREQRWDEAIDRFERLGTADSEEIQGLRSRYWRARAMEKAGRPAAAGELAAIAREFPLSYYGWRAQERGADPGAGPEAAVSIDSLRGSAVLSPRDLARPEILLEAGLVAEARGELDQLYERAKGLDDRLALAQLYADAGDFNRPERLMVEAYLEPLARGPLPGAIELWWHAWPLPFVDEVVDSTSDGGALVEPPLVYAVMREESGYRPEVMSVVGARGLLQLMPVTAERVADGLGLEGYSPDDLFLPEVNIRLGAAYLEQLLARFSGRASAAIGSYNAGPEVVARWLAQTPGEDDEWVEAIPYEETRKYVKRVLRSLHAYRVLY